MKMSMINPSSEKDEVGSKKELEEAAGSRSCSSSRQWTSSFKNPRIVRVSRSFGGKDRHSKVCTVRGLRDRRIRLSVPTAIQLYDLQDRLGLTQPSKVIDWLIDATKHEIDNLPPLPMLPTTFLHYFHQPSSILQPTTTTSSSSSPYNYNYSSHQYLLSPHLFKETDQRWNITTSTASLGSSHDRVDGGSAHNFFPLNSQFSVPNMMPPYNSNYFQLDDTTTTPNLSLSQFGGAGFSDHHQPHSNCTLSSSSTSTSQQIYMCPSATSITPFPPYINADDHEFRQINHYQNSVLMPTTLHLINSPIKSFTSLHSNPNDQTQKQDQDRST